MTEHAQHHDEVLAALAAIGNPRRGEAIRIDRGSELQCLGIGFPALRAGVKQGFSFSNLPEAEALAIWDGLWRSSPYGDVLFAALETLEPVVRKRVPPALWPAVRHWSERIDNRCHSDALSGLYSRVLEAQFGAVTAFLERHAARMSSRAYTRAVERRTPAERAQLLAKRRARAGARHWLSECVSRR